MTNKEQKSAEVAPKTAAFGQKSTEVLELQRVINAVSAACDMAIRRAEALEAELEAVGAGGVQALSAAPEGWKLVPAEPTDQMVQAAHHLDLSYMPGQEGADRAAIYRAMLAASPTPPAEQQAPNTGHAEVDRLIGRLMSSDPDFEDCRQAAALIQREVKGPDGFWTWREAAIAERLTRVNQQAAPKAAPVESRQIGVIRFDKHKHPYAVLQTCSDGTGNAWVAETPIYAGQAPQQEAQEPHGWLYDWTHSSATGKPDATYTAFTTDEAHARKHGNCRAIYTAPQPAPAPLSDDVVRDAAFEAVRKKLCALPRYSFVLDDDGLVRRAQERTGNWIEFDEAHALFDPIAIDAALAAQGGRDAG